MTIERDFDKQNFLHQGAIFSKNEVVWLMWGAPQIHQHRPEALALLVRDFLDQSAPSWLLYPFAMQLSLEEARSLFIPDSTEVSWEDLSPESFQKQFQLVQKKLGTEEIEKAVPYTFESAAFKNSASHLESFLGSGLATGENYLYGQWEDGSGFLGMTPEILVSQLSESQFKTMALAGTWSIEDYELDPPSFLNDPKEKVEHLKVVEDLVEQLDGLGELLVSETSVKTTPHLAHLFTALELTIHRPMGVEKLIERLHPTPALGVFPRKKAWELLREFEKIEPRNRFGAPFGISYSRKKADIVVAIRNICWDSSTIKIGSGCGVVKSSLYDNEWNELKLKRNSVKQIFGLK